MQVDIFVLNLSLFFSNFMKIHTYQREIKVIGTYYYECSISENTFILFFYNVVLPITNQCIESFYKVERMHFADFISKTGLALLFQDQWLFMKDPTELGIFK